jgi:Fe-S-cluster containining protein
MARQVTHRYVDPLSEIWLATAARLGLRVRRVADAYASTDGAGEMAIATDEALDADDSLAQMIFHEICHSLVEGREAFGKPDWGIDNTGDAHEWREHACLRAQWVLAGRYGLRAVLAPTTDFRAIWDGFDGGLLADRADLSVQAAIVAIGRAGEEPWAPALDEALEATARMAGEVARLRQLAAAAKRGGAGKQAASAASAAAVDGDGSSPLPSLWREAAARPAAHGSGLPMGGAPQGASCATCAWRVAGKSAPRCRQAGKKIDDAWPACERYERELDCLTCGACCREAYQSVEVSPKDRMIKRHPELVVDRGTYLEVRRSGERCAALTGGEVEVRGVHRRMLPVACAIYDGRPRTCRDFTLGSEHCLTARQRVGLSL